LAFVLGEVVLDAAGGHWVLEGTGPVVPVLAVLAVLAVPDQGRMDAEEAVETTWCEEKEKKQELMMMV
jgi:hypothetical protein